MGFYFLLYWHFLMMIMFLMLFSGIITLLYSQFSSIVVLIVSGLIGFVYSILIEIKDSSFLFISINLIVTVIPILLMRYLLFLKRKAEEMEREFEGVSKE